MRSYALTVIFTLTATVLAVDSLGGWKDVDVKDELVVKAGEFAHKQMALQMNHLYQTRMGRVIKAASQLVAGTNYRLTIEVEVTDCRAAAGIAFQELSSCRRTGTEQCEVVVWYQAWREPAMQLTSFECKAVEQDEPNDKSKKPMPGAPMAADLTSEEIGEAVSFAIGQLNSASNGFYAVQLSRISSATTQVVAGVRIVAKISAMLTSCMEANTEVHQCAANSYRRESIECTVDVWDQPWRTPRHILMEHHCGMPTEGAQEDNSLRFVPHDTGANVIGVEEHDGGRASWDTRPLIGSSLSDFQDFKAKFGRVYKNADEEQMRYKQFRANMRLAQFIQDHDSGDAVYGATQFADLTPEEFQAYVSKTWNKETDFGLKPAVIPNVDPPRDFDWREKNIVTPVKNQGSCGSCWAFCVTGNIEGQWALKKSQLVSLSEQQLVDCDKIDEGCNGGLPSQAYEEIQRMGGLESEEDYPYKGKDDQCHFLSEKIKVYINGSVNISKDEAEMAQWLYKNGPMAIGINAMFMQFYFGGISHPWKILCPDALNHGVLIVGYGVRHRAVFGDTPYWIIKNSWGPGWGEKGYYLIYRGDGSCGLNEMVSSATVE